mgnify:FL=1
MVSFPVEILTGRLTTPEILTGLGIQAAWVAAAAALAWLLWRRGVKHFTALGN